MKQKQQGQFGFTLIELLVVIGIIGVLASIALLSLAVSRGKARDAKRVADVRQMSTTFESFFLDNFRYPSATAGLPQGLTPTYMQDLPVAPNPQDGSCSAAQNVYTYALGTSSSSYTYTFCLGRDVAGLGAGFHTLDSSGIR